MKTRRQLDDLGQNRRLDNIAGGLRSSQTHGLCISCLPICMAAARAVTAKVAANDHVFPHVHAYARIPYLISYQQVKSQTSSNYNGWDRTCSTMRETFASRDSGTKVWFVMIKDEKESHPGNPLWGNGCEWAFFNSDLGREYSSEKTAGSSWRLACPMGFSLAGR